MLVFLEKKIYLLALCPPFSLLQQFGLPLNLLIIFFFLIRSFCACYSLCSSHLWLLKLKYQRCSVFPEQYAWQALSPWLLSLGPLFLSWYNSRRGKHAYFIHQDNPVVSIDACHMLVPPQKCIEGRLFLRERMGWLLSEVKWLLSQTDFEKGKFT